MPVDYTTTTLGGIRVPTAANDGNNLEAGLVTMANDLVLDVVTALPGAPVDGQEVYFQSSAMAAAGGAPWHLRYRAAASGSYKWEPVAGGLLTADVNASETTSSTTFADLTTVGPQVAVPLAGDYLIDFGATVSPQNLTGGGGLSGGALIGVIDTTTGALSARRCVVSAQNMAAASGLPVSSMMSQVSTITGAHTLKLQYYATGSLAANFADRWLRVRPLRVG